MADFDFTKAETEQVRQAELAKERGDAKAAELHWALALHYQGERMRIKYAAPMGQA